MNLIGEFLGSSGYANHTRYLANELNKLTDIKLITSLPVGYERDVNDKELEMIKREETLDVNLIITHPLFWRTNCFAKRNIVYLVWEGDKIPKWMLEECFNPAIEKIIVPSQHTRDALWNTYWEGSEIEEQVEMSNKGEDKKFWDKIITIPHGVDLETFYPIETKSDDFKFLSSKGFVRMGDRSGTQYLIKAYLEEFLPEEKVELIVKINPAYGVPNIEEMFPELKKLTPKIKFIIDDYNKKQLNELYNECDVYVSPTRAESFNLPIAESAACGKMSISTNFGGQTDIIIDKKTGLLINYDLHEQNDPEYESIKWATPRINELKKYMRWCYDNKEEVKIMGDKALDNIKKYTWSNTAKQIHTLLKCKHI